MQYMPNAADTAEMKSIFGEKLWTDANPFYNFGVYCAPVFGDNDISSQTANQMFATKIRKDVYRVRINIIISYMLGYRTSASAFLECNYNAVTGKLTKITASYVLGDYQNNTTPINMKRTGAVSDAYTELAQHMYSYITIERNNYIDGLRQYCAQKKTYGSYLD